jgi:hypothetical protein
MTMHIIINTLGTGKTTFLTWMAWINWLKGRRVYSNYILNFPFEPVKSLEDLDNVRTRCTVCDEAKVSGVEICLRCGTIGLWTKPFLAIDDAYQWFYAPKGYNPYVDKILACSRKRGVDIAYTMTRSNQVHINIRVNTAYVWVPMLIPNADLMVAPQFKYLPDRGLKGGDEERIGDIIQQFLISNVPEIWEMYNTEEEIGELIGVGNDVRARAKWAVQLAQSVPVAGAA